MAGPVHMETSFGSDTSFGRDTLSGRETLVQTDTPSLKGTLISAPESTAGAGCP